MNDLTLTNKNLQVSEWKKKIGDSSSLHSLQERLDLAEKNLEKPFADFSDVEMIQWFLYRKEHLDRQHDKSIRTIKEYERELTQFVEQLVQYSKEINIDMDYIIEGSLFKSLSPRHIRRYQEWLAERSPYVQKKGLYSPATLARKTTIIKNFLQFMYEVEYIHEPLQKGLFTATVRKDDRPNRDLGPQEVIQLLDYFRRIKHPVAFTIIHILTTTGLRNEEFCKLKVGDLQYDSITNSYYLNVLGKGNKQRQIPLKEKTLDSIRIFRDARGLENLSLADKESPLMTTNTGKAYTPSYLSQYLTKMIKETYLPSLLNRSSSIGPHTFRHAFAIISHKSGVDIYQIMRSLGHEKIETTMIYLEKIFEKERHAIHGWNPEVFGEYI
ncbi:tyrosine-type recombinase/integrase [Niallia endozanthoxylica]|uniref:Tyrosine-type recombinase/integrase n=1 Tax=Niallia endozanthoxylica TaxID=2036016 RepID=A0A5J5GVF5_9BACI|nr:tyrosine-type recombinase/integrase [Niallia endozanthoxylica]KAA9012296.1 tyrosine-type recombinase/integrase [Niallia endozanthoxylica]